MLTRFKRHPWERLATLIIALVAATAGLTACAQGASPRTASTPAAIPASHISTLVSTSAALPAASRGSQKPTVKMYAKGTGNITSVAWGDNAMFAGASPNGGKDGGVYIVANGSVKEIPYGPEYVAGMTWHDGALYLSDEAVTGGKTQFRIERWSDFNGSTFIDRQIIYTGPSKRFQGFNGLAFGANGRLYTGVELGLTNGNDHGPASTWFDLYKMLSMTDTGQDVTVFASGIRQPWQMVFPAGSNSPFVSDLGQNSGAVNPPDLVLRVKTGDNFGFPTCNFTTGSPCSSDAQPFAEFPTHTSIMGLAIIGGTLYMTSYDGISGEGGGALLSMPVSGGAYSKVITGLPIAADALGAHNGKLYVGGATQKALGEIYQVTP